MSTPRPGEQSPGVEGASSEDRVEQGTPVVGGPAADVPAADLEVPLEAGSADVVEQAADAGPPEAPLGTTVPLEADPADAAEQAAVVELDEDEHR